MASDGVLTGCATGGVAGVGESDAAVTGVGALYVHVPFCTKKCAYCDFESAAVPRDARIDAYVCSTIEQIKAASELGLLHACKTAYVGGGTPTYVGASLLGRLVRAIRRACPELRELTCEANPDSLTDEVLQTVVAAGATRLSIGVQSFDDAELHALGRIHTATQAYERVSQACKSGLDVSVDLMCAIPKQTRESWRRTLDEAVSLGVNHVSVYPLAIEEGTPLERLYRDQETPWNDEDVQAERMEEAERVLRQVGLARYEVASYARPGYECQHNIAYWTGVPYLGVGRGAASMLDENSYAVARRLYEWLPSAEATATRMRFSTLDREVEFLTRREAWAEDLMLGMRLVRGIEATRLESEPETRDDLLRRGLIERRGNRLVPTHDGWLLGNELYATLWSLSNSR